MAQFPEKKKQNQRNNNGVCVCVFKHKSLRGSRLEDKAGSL